MESQILSGRCFLCFDHFCSTPVELLLLGMQKLIGFKLEIPEGSSSPLRWFWMTVLRRVVPWGWLLAAGTSGCLQAKPHLSGLE